MTTRQQLIGDILERMNQTKRIVAGYAHMHTSGLMLSPAQLEMLFTISQLQPVSSKVLADHMKLTAGAVSQVSDVLAGHDLIIRESGQSDRRVQLLRVSEKGLAQIRRMQEERNKLFVEIMEGFSDQELEIWLRIQERVVEVLESRRAQAAEQKERK